MGKIKVRFQTIAITSPEDKLQRLEITGLTGFSIHNKSKTLDCLIRDDENQSTVKRIAPLESSAFSLGTDDVFDGHLLIDWGIINDQRNAGKAEITKFIKINKTN